MLARLPRTVWAADTDPVHTYLLCCNSQPIDRLIYQQASDTLRRRPKAYGLLESHFVDDSDAINAQYGEHIAKLRRDVIASVRPPNPFGDHEREQDRPAFGIQTGALSIDYRQNHSPQ